MNEKLDVNNYNTELEYLLDNKNIIIKANNSNATALIKVTITTKNGVATCPNLPATICKIKITNPSKNLKIK